MSGLVKHLQQKTKPQLVGCTNCEKGKKRIPKKPLGWDVTLCDCYFEYEWTRRVLELTKKSCIPKGLLFQNPLGTFEPTGIVTEELLQKSIVSNTWLYFYGLPGTGKTFSAIAAAQLALCAEKFVFFTTFIDLLSELRPSGDERRFMTRAKHADVLILDDLGQEKITEWARTQLYAILNHRWSENKMTIITSNKPMISLKDINPAIYSRVASNAFEFDFSKEKDKRFR